MINNLKKSFKMLYLKIALGMLVIITANIFFVFSISNNFFHDYFEKHYQGRVSSTLFGLDFGISVLLDKGDFDSIQRMIEKVGAYSFVDKIRVFDLNNKVISSNNKSEIDKKIKIKIVDEVIKQNKLQNIDSNFKEKKYQAAVPIKGNSYHSLNENDIVGVIFIQTNTNFIEMIAMNYRKLFMEKNIISGLLMLLVIYILLAYKIFSPILRLFNAAARVSNGNYTQEILDKSNNEFSYLIKKFNFMIKQINIRDIELKEIKEELEIKNKVLEQKVNKRTKELKATQEFTIKSLANLAETRDNETGMHIYRTKKYVNILASYLKEHPKFSDHLSETKIGLIVDSAVLHDIGKVGIPDSILMKPGKLTKEEFEEMKKHTTYGRNSILKAEKTMGTSSFLRFAKEIAYSHHEKWDGSGYPQGLVGKEIPVSARLMAIADVYDALVSERQYKAAFTHEEAVKIITVGDGRTMPEHFDPHVLDAFKNLHHKFKEIYLKFPENKVS